MELSIKLSRLADLARDLIGPDNWGMTANPEYTRAMVELIASTLPGDSEAAREYVTSLLEA